MSQSTAHLLSAHFGISAMHASNLARFAVMNAAFSFSEKPSVPIVTVVSFLAADGIVRRSSSFGCGPVSLVLMRGSILSRMHERTDSHAGSPCPGVHAAQHFL